MQPQVAHHDGPPRILDEIREQGDLGANPQAIERLQQALNKEHCSNLGLAHAILQDPGLAAKILRVVNSVAYSVRGEPVSTITRAIVMIGFERVREIATGLLLIQRLTHGQPGNAAVHDNLRRALRCALTSQAIAVRAGQVAPEQAYLLGLFANLGLLWLAAHYPDVLARAFELERAGSSTLDAAVTACAGVSPDRLAAEVLRHWSLPDTYVHHFQRRTGELHALRGEGADRLSAVVEVADAYTRAAELGVPLDEARLKGLVAGLNLTPQRLCDALAAVDEELPSHTRLLGIDPPRECKLHAAGAPDQTSAATVACEPTGGVGATVAGESAGAGSAAAARRGDMTLALDVGVEITRSILADDDVNHNLTAVVEGIARSGGFDVVVIGLVNATRDQVSPRFCYGADLEREAVRLAVPLRPGAGVIAEAVLDSAPRVVERGSIAMLVPPGASAPPIVASSFLVQPLAVRGRAIGVVVATRSGQPAVTRADLPIVQMFANLACIGLREMQRR